MELIKVKLDAFEGPLDLLLHLIEKNEINIYDIPITELTDQYMEYLNEISNKNMNQLSEFLVIATTLLEIKSKMLLPALPKTIEEEIDPRDELVNKLIEYKRFKKILSIFKDKEVYASQYLYRKADDEIIKVLKSNNLYNLDKILNGVTIDELFQIFDDTLRRRESKTDVIRHGFKSVKKDIYTIEEKINYILDLLIINKQIYFFEIFESTFIKMEMVVTFLAILELVKIKKINIIQNELFGDILIEACTKGGENDID